MLGTFGHSGGAQSLPADVVQTGPQAVFAHVQRQGSDRLLWITDGTRAETRAVRRRVLRDPRHITAIGGGLALFDGTSASNQTGSELWITDGTDAGTNMLRDISPNSSSSPQYFAALGDGRVLFSAAEMDHGRELWITNLTRRGTRMLVDIVPGANPWDGAPRNITTLRPGLAVFTAYTPEHGRELWVSDGTRRGTMMLADLNPGNNGQSDTNDQSVEVLHPAVIVPAEPGRAFFIHGDADGHGLWITDGTPDGTQRLNASGFLARPGVPVALSGGRWLFSASTAEGASTFVTDGTPAGTVQLRPGGERLHADTNRAVPLGDGRVVFAAYRAATGWEPWITNGRPVRTRMLQDIFAGTGSSIDAGVVFVALGDGRALFPATSLESTGQELFRTDGTGRGTRMVRNINPVGGSFPTRITPLGDGRALFQANDGTRGREVWITDGTRTGTRIVLDIGSGPAGDLNAPTGLTVLQP